VGLGAGLLAAGLLTTPLFFLRQASDRGVAKWIARVMAEETGKPTINIGAKRDKWGDVRCDINPQGGAVYADAADTGFGDKTFSVALLSHILEHVDDPERVLHEAHRIADEVVVVLPNAFDLFTWASPQHKWVFLGGNMLENNPPLVTTALTTIGAIVGVAFMAKRSERR
jgi:SAM-dependent methyltransferase